MLKPGDSYEKVYSSFSWKIPEYYNIGVDICDKHAHQRYRLALVYENDTGKIEKYTFWDLKRLSNQFANTLKAYGLNAGDRVGILLPQCPEAAIAHIGTYKIGAVAIPLFTLFGTDALEYRLNNSEARCVVTDTANMDKLLQIRDKLPRLDNIFVVRGGENKNIVSFVHSINYC